MYYIDSLILYLAIFFISLSFSRMFSGRLWFLLILFLSFSFGLRQFIGNDWDQYVNIFRVINIYETPITIEPGAYIINALAGNISLEFGYYIVFFIYSYLTFYFTYKSLIYYKCESLFVLSIFLTGFVFFSNNAIRQALAISFLLYSSRYIYSDRLKFILMMLFSSIMFHYSSLLSIFLILVPKKDYPRYVYFCVLVISFVLNKLFLINALLSKVIELIPYYGDIYFSRIENFTSQEQGIGLVITLYYLIIAFCIFHKDKFRVDIYNIFVFGALICLAGIENEMWERVTIPYFYFLVLFLPLLIKATFFRSWINLSLTSLLVGVLTVLLCSQIVTNSNKNGVSPFYHHIYSESDYEP